jgi:hypothetical protein
MTLPITREFCWAEADRLLRLAVSAIDRGNRSQLLEIAGQYRQMAAKLQSDRADAANSNEIERHGSGTV